MNIIAKVDASEIRHPFTGADWWFDENGDLQVRVSKLSDWRFEAALMLHEIAESLICKHTGVTVAQVDEWDKHYDKTHEFDLNSGDDPFAPYKKEHTFATAIERIFTGATDVDWLTYDKELEAIPSLQEKTL